MNRCHFRELLLVFGLLMISAHGWAQSGSVASLGPAQMATLRSQVEEFEALINRDLQSALDHPFGMLQDPKGTYLPSFGVVFHMELNLAPMRMMTMFDVRPYTEEELQQTRQAKLQRIGNLKAHLSELLRLHGGELSVLSQEQRIAVTVHLFNMPSERTEGLPTQLILEVSRGAITELQARKATAEEFRNEITILDF